MDAERAGADVVQLYVGIPGGAPRRQLRRPTTRCACGRESRSRPTFALTQRDLSV
ncbi:hypothetical protein NHJ13734_009301 [Beauveria thailandica]